MFGNGPVAVHHKMCDAAAERRRSRTTRHDGAWTPLAELASAGGDLRLRAGATASELAPASDGSRTVDWWRKKKGARGTFVA